MDLNIEGTKHEKAVLVVLSYIAGFTAGFLVFGFSLQGYPETDMSSFPTNSDMMDTVQDQAVDHVHEVSIAPEPVIVNPAGEEVEYKNGRLMANVNGASVLLSAQTATVDADTAKTFASQGVHEAIPNYQASDDGQYIYYCEQHTNEDLCTNFIYSVADEMIYFVTLNGEKLITPAAVSQTAFWTPTGLSIGTASSMSPATPWKLVTR